MPEFPSAQLLTNNCNQLGKSGHVLRDERSSGLGREYERALQCLHSVYSCRMIFASLWIFLFIAISKPIDNRVL